MTLSHPSKQAWRERAALISSKLDCAHSCVHLLGDALERGDTRSARSRYGAALREVNSVEKEVKTLRNEQPSTKGIDQPMVIGSALTVNGGGAATAALDVMADSMVALAATEDEDATDVLIGTCIDAAEVYEHSTAIVQGASQSHGSEMLGLKQSFDADGEVALRNKVVVARAQMREINERFEHGRENWAPPQRVKVGAAVEVRNRFVRTWCHGFKVADHVDGGYVILRSSDDVELPEVMRCDDVRSDGRSLDI